MSLPEVVQKVATCGRIVSVPASNPRAHATCMPCRTWHMMCSAGDCRAVLSKQGKAVVLTRDHRPDDPEERLRIYAAGGFVCYDDRVAGRYAVSRVIGDFGCAQTKGDPTAGEHNSSFQICFKASMYSSQRSNLMKNRLTLRICWPRCNHGVIVTIIIYR